MIQVDLRGLVDKQPFERLRDTMKPYCGQEMEAEILIDDEGSLTKIRQFVAMSGCISSVDKSSDHWVLKVAGDACHCR